MPRSQRPIDLMKTLEKVRFPSAVVDRRGAIIWLNRAAKASFGDIVRRALVSAVAPGYIAPVERQHERLLRGVPVTDYEVEMLTADGRRRCAEISAVAIKGGDACQAIFGIAVLGPRRPARSAQLTARQNEILQLLGEGGSTNEMAASLHLSKETVRNHIRRILRTLGVHSRLEAVVVAHQAGLLAGED